MPRKPIRPATLKATPNATDTAALAYQLWMERGCPIGSDQEDWFRAEAILSGKTGERVEELAASA